MLPIVTLIALSLGFIVGGAIPMTSTSSRGRGSGLLYLEAVAQRD